MAVLDDPDAELTFKDATAHRRRVYFRNFRGKIVIAKWPKKRGRKQPPINKAWQEKFAGVSAAIKFVDPCSQAIARLWTRNTGWYYRDLLSSVMFGNWIRYEGTTKIKTPTCSLYNNSNTAVPASTWTPINVNGSNWDNNNFAPGAISPNVTIHAAGLYWFSASVGVSGSAANRDQHLRITDDGFPVPFQAFNNMWANADFPISFSGVWYFLPEHVLNVEYFCNGAAVNAKLYSLQLVAITPEALIP